MNFYRQLQPLKYLCVVLVISTMQAANAQPVPGRTSQLVRTKAGTRKKVVAPLVICDPVEKMPELITGGGMRGVAYAIGKNTTHPVLDSEGNLAEGRVFVGFTVQPDGSVNAVHIIKGLNSACDSVAVRAVRQLPQFIPGYQYGHTVLVGITVPVRFHAGEVVVIQ